jgi:hypothetical protein
MPPANWTGRPRTYCSEGCREEAAAIRYEVRSRRERRREEERREAEWRARQKAREEEAARRYEEERRHALAAGGIDALDFLQREAFEDERCGWYEDDDDPEDGVCQTRVTARTGWVWCVRHNRQLEREIEERKRQREADVRP